MSDIDSHLRGEFDAIAGALRTQRPEATPLELDRIKVVARQRASRRARSQMSRKGLLMRSRLFVTALVAGGILMLGGGAALGISGLSSTRSASIAQYGTGTTTGTTTSTTTATTVTNPVVTHHADDADGGHAADRHVRGGARDPRGRQRGGAGRRRPGCEAGRIRRAAVHRLSRDSGAAHRPRDARSRARAAPQQAPARSHPVAGAST